MKKVLIVDDDTIMRVTQLAVQIPKIKRNGKVMTVQHGHYVLFYAVSRKEDYHSDITALVRRLQIIWKNYMNLMVSAAVCEAREAPELKTAVEYGENLLLLSPLEGMLSFHTEWEKNSIAEGLDQSKKSTKNFYPFYMISMSLAVSGKN